jgi:hypothetical protein
MSMAHRVGGPRDNGAIVGSNQIYSNGTRQDLDNLLQAGSPYQIMYANGINDNGQIDANAKQGQAVLRTPS